jgi:hypothetical protein
MINSGASFDFCSMSFIASLLLGTPPFSGDRIQIRFETVKTFAPELAIDLHLLHRLLERLGTKVAAALLSLRLAANT